MVCKDGGQEPLAITRVWQKWRFSAPQTHLWLIKVWFSASTFVVIIATFAKPETVSGNLNNFTLNMNYLIFPILQTVENTSKVISKFKLRLDYVIEIYDSEIELNKAVCPTLPKDAPRHEEFRIIQEIRKELFENLNSKTDIEYKTSDYIDVFVSQLIFDKKFESVYCQECFCENNIDDVIIREWSMGEGLCAQGGRIMSCKNEHDVYKMMEWIS